MKTKSLRGPLLLLLGSVIWGAAFSAQRAAMDHIGPFTFNGIRMLLAGIVMIPVAVLSAKKHGTPAGARPSLSRDQRRAGLLCGLFLFAASALQQLGLVSTSAGKSGFLTALYVVLVPIAGWLIFLKNPGRVIWLGVVLAVAALYLLCVSPEGFSLQSGDLYLLGCSVCFTAQILCVDIYAPRVSGVRLARDEFLVTGALCSVIALCTETLTPEGLLGALIPLLYAGIFSGAMGYTLQILGQRDTDPTVASLLMCLESVFAVLTGALLLGETLTLRESAGCALMFSAVILAVLSPVLSARRRAGGGKEVP